MDALLAGVASHGCDVLAMQHVRLKLAALHEYDAGMASVIVRPGSAASWHVDVHVQFDAEPTRRIKVTGLF